MPLLRSLNVSTAVIVAVVDSETAADAANEAAAIDAVAVTDACVASIAAIAANANASLGIAAATTVAAATSSASDFVSVFVSTDAAHVGRAVGSGQRFIHPIHHPNPQ